MGRPDLFPLSTKYTTLEQLWFQSASSCCGSDASIQPVCQVQGFVEDARCCTCVHRNSSVWGQKACSGGGGRCSPGTINPSVQVSNQILLWQALWDYPRLLRALTAVPAGPGKQHCLLNSSRPAFSLARPGGAAKAHGPLLSWPARRAFRGMYGQDGTLVFTEPAEGNRNPRPDSW